MKIKPFSLDIVKDRTNLKLNADAPCMSRRMKMAEFTAFLFCCMIVLPLEAQEQSSPPSQGFTELVAWAYGQDQELVNGLQYYNRHPRSLGHPYLNEGLVHKGAVKLRGKLYNGIWLKYDIHSQQVEVEYQTMSGADNLVVLVGDRVDNFSIGDSFFERLLLEEGQPKFYQVIGEGRMVWYIHWEKKLVPVSGDYRFSEEYTSPRRSYFLELDGELHPFNSKKSLIQLFPKSNQKDLKNFFKSNQIQIRTATTRQLELFILAATNLLYGGSP